MPNPSEKTNQNYLLGWLAIGIVLTGLVFVFVHLSLPKNRINGSSSGRVSIQTLGEKAFGSLAKSSTSGAPEGGGAAGDRMTQTTIAPAPEGFKQYVYEYNGPLPKVDFPVLRRSTNLGQSQLASLLPGRLTNLVNPDRLESMRVQQMTLTDPNQSGAVVTLDYLGGSISLYNNSTIRTVQSEPGLVNGMPVDEIVPLPSDTEVIRAANTFLQEWQISREGLGEPIINKYWLDAVASEGSAKERPTLVGSDMSIVYPWKINGRNVFDEGGSPYGLYIGVNIDTLAVTSFSNLVPMRFDASDYELVTDEATIRAALRSGGVYYLGGGTLEGAEVVTVPADQPEAAYMISRYQLEQNQVEYLVPALRFTIISSDSSFYPKFVMVPLVVEMLKSQPTPVPVPLTPTIDATEPSQPTPQ